MSLRYPILAGTRESNTTNHISLYNDHDEQDISGCSIDKDTTTTKDDNETVLPPELYAVIMECKFLVCNYNVDRYIYSFYLYITYLNHIANNI